MKKRLNIAALGALMNGDMENANIAMTPGGIERQEAEGQKGFVNSSTLPLQCNYCTWEQLEAMGIKRLEEKDDLFVKVILPEGWRKEATDHSMWSNLLDENDRKRASIFYKAAFYDRSAHISLERRFSYRVRPLGGYTDNYQEDKKKPLECVVLDGEVVIWTAPDTYPVEPSYDEKDKWMSWYDNQKQFNKLGETWLNENYPDWQNPLAYWEE